MAQAKSHKQSGAGPDREVCAKLVARFESVRIPNQLARVHTQRFCAVLISIYFLGIYIIVTTIKRI
jgi:hypothetical protein